MRIACDFAVVSGMRDAEQPDWLCDMRILPIKGASLEAFPSGVGVILVVNSFDDFRA
jgi:hypothetical protein